MTNLKKPSRLHFIKTFCTRESAQHGVVCYFYFLGKAILRDLNEGQLNLRAMGLVYTTLLSIVPLLALSFSILKGFGVHQRMEPILLQLLEPLGDKSIEITEQIFTFVNNINIGVLGATGLLILLYTVISLMKKIEEAFNFTWRVETSRNLAHRFSHYFSILLIGPILIFSALGLWAAFLDTSVMQSISESYGTVLTTLTKYLPKLLIISAFGLVYLLIPNTKVSFKAALGGAVVAGLLWQAGSIGFATFVSNSSKQTAIYSAFASMMFFMIWMYLSWLFLLIGASIAYYLQHPQSVHFPAKSLHLSPQLEKTLAVSIMQLAYRQSKERKQPFTSDDFATLLFIHKPIVKQILQLLTEHHILLIDNSTPPRYSAYIPHTELTLDDIQRAINIGIKRQTRSTDRAYRANADLQALDQRIASTISTTLINDIDPRSATTATTIENT
ncbi:MAG: YihY/virulence factor BrkB family protein [Thiotrichaceae bacterium]